ncbi:hypothetical protein NC651_008598 [Populus alba x Populus x berolinensis]|nr:hypothetical protein NC651_008598 [Populus alba x Populus x berolinensis]
MDFRHLQNFNLALLTKLRWKLVVEPHSLVSQIIKAKYYLRGDFLNANLGHGPSFVWHSILSSQEVIKRGCRWRIDKGIKVNARKDSWLSTSPNKLLETLMIKGLESLQVYRLITERGSLLG